MVRGLFPAYEQALVLDLLERSIILLTPATIDAFLQSTRGLATAWNLANLYLGGLGADLLAEDAPRLLGLSEETSCYLSAASFDAPGRFEDFVVHEAAHIFHNCKRETIGLRETRTREWLLEIDYGKRETFAYACEAYSRMHALGDGPRGRQELLAEHEQGSMPPDERVDAVEYVDILREAVAARNGWKRILQRCSLPRVARRARDGSSIMRLRSWKDRALLYVRFKATGMTNRITDLGTLRKAAARNGPRRSADHRRTCNRARAESDVEGARGRLRARDGDLADASATANALLDEVQKFQVDSLAGRYFEDFEVNSRNCTEHSRGTDAFTAEFKRLLCDGIGASDNGQYEVARQTLELLFGLLRHIDECHDDVLFFADEGGSWQLGIDWHSAFAAYFRCLAETATAADFATNVDQTIEDFAEHERPQHLRSAHSVANAAQRATLEPLERRVADRQRR
jgi:hypothetical protein